MSTTSGVSVKISLALVSETTVSETSIFSSFKLVTKFGFLLRLFSECGTSLSSSEFNKSRISSSSLKTDELKG